MSKLEAMNEASAAQLTELVSQVQKETKEQLKEILNRAKFFDSTGLDKVFAEVTQAAKAAAELAGGEGGGKKNKWAGLSMGNVHARKGLSGAAAML